MKYYTIIWDNKKENKQYSGVYPDYLKEDIISKIEEAGLTLKEVFESNILGIKKRGF